MNNIDYQYPANTYRVSGTSVFNCVCQCIDKTSTQTTLRSGKLHFDQANYTLLKMLHQLDVTQSLQRNRKSLEWIFFDRMITTRQLSQALIGHNYWRANILRCSSTQIYTIPMNSPQQRITAARIKVVCTFTSSWHRYCFTNDHTKEQSIAPGLREIRSWSRSRMRAVGRTTVVVGRLSIQENVRNSAA